MHGNLPAADSAAISAPVKSDADENADGKSDGEECGWFADAARGLLPHKAGTALHFATGFDERLCQKYAAGKVKPSAYFLRALLRSDGGWQWLSALMDGSDAQWWRDLQRARRVIAQLDTIDMR